MLNTAMTGKAGLAALGLLFLASLAYVAVGGTFVPEASPFPEPEISMAKIAVIPAEASGVRRDKKVSGSSAPSTEHSPEAYATRSRDSDGNVMTYEHD